MNLPAIDKRARAAAEIANVALALPRHNDCMRCAHGLFDKRDIRASPPADQRHARIEWNRGQIGVDLSNHCGGRLFFSVRLKPCPSGGKNELEPANFKNVPFGQIVLGDFFAVDKRPFPAGEVANENGVTGDDDERVCLADRATDQVQAAVIARTGHDDGPCQGNRRPASQLSRGDKAGAGNRDFS